MISLWPFGLFNQSGTSHFPKQLTEIILSTSKCSQCAMADWELVRSFAASTSGYCIFNSILFVWLLAVYPPELIGYAGFITRNASAIWTSIWHKLILFQIDEQSHHIFCTHFVIQFMWNLKHSIAKRHLRVWLKY